jgi:hypothetical protein
MQVGNQHLQTFVDRAGVFRAYNLDLYLAFVLLLISIGWLASRCLCRGRGQARQKGGKDE